MVRLWRPVTGKWDESAQTLKLKPYNRQTVATYAISRGGQRARQLEAACQTFARKHGMARLIAVGRAGQNRCFFRCPPARALPTGCQRWIYLLISSQASHSPSKSVHTIFLGCGGDLCHPRVHPSIQSGQSNSLSIHGGITRIGSKWYLFRMLSRSRGINARRHPAPP